MEEDQISYFLQFSEFKLGIYFDESNAEEFISNYIKMKSISFKKYYNDNVNVYRRTNDVIQKLTKQEVDNIYLLCKKLLDPASSEIKREVDTHKASETIKKNKLRTRAATRMNIIVVFVLIYIFVFIKGVIIHYITEMNINKLRMNA